jgi:hypothetical protein
MGFYLQKNRVVKRLFTAVVSNQIISVATFATIVATKVFLLPLLSEFERYCSLFIIRNTFLSNCLSPHSNLLLPHVANGDKVGQHWFTAYFLKRQGFTGCQNRS